MPFVFLWLWKNKIHFFVLVLLAVYLLSANIIYTTFFLKNGKPLKNSPSLPSQTTEMVCKITSFDNILYDGQDLYEMRGYVFSPGSPDSAQFNKTLLLHSTSEDLFFPADLVYWRNLTLNFPQYLMNVDNAGFRVLISKDLLKLDNYQVGFLLKSKDGATRVFQRFDTYIERAPNRLRLISEP